MSEPTRTLTDNLDDGAVRIPTNPVCAACGVRLSERFGWCGNCRAALCLDCGRAHFCTSGCAAAGCRAGLCVRLVEDGRIVATWGLPPDR